MSLNLFSADKPIIIDHNCTNLDEVPSSWIVDAKSNFRMSYGHTSHGSQIVTGISITFDRYGDLYRYQTISLFGQSVPDGVFAFRDRYPSGDLGSPNRTNWASATRDLLDHQDCDINLIMWSWCGQAGTASESDMNTYLNLMNALETDYPNVTFVYMTGHLDGSGEEGNLNIRNEQIRNFCKQNNKILFDFADIESYDPDGNYFLDKGANDACYYWVDGTRLNWAEEWCLLNPGECDNCSCAHSHCLNCRQKGQAFWWMMATISGWDQGTDVKIDEDRTTSAYPNPAFQIAYIDYYVEFSGLVNIEVFDSFGNKVRTLLNAEIGQGQHKAVFTSSNLPSGVYFFTITQVKNIKTGSIVFTK